jgi:hypothetical protein
MCCYSVREMARNFPRIYNIYTPHVRCNYPTEPGFGMDIEKAHVRDTWKSRMLIGFYPCEAFRYSEGWVVEKLLVHPTIC